MIWVVVFIVACVLVFAVAMGRMSGDADRQAARQAREREQD